MSFPVRGIFECVVAPVGEIPPTVGDPSSEEKLGALERLDMSLGDAGVAFPLDELRKRAKMILELRLVHIPDPACNCFKSGDPLRRQGFLGELQPAA